MCLALPRWPTDRLMRARALRDETLCDGALIDGARPVVLYERTARALRLYAVNRPAARLGLARGQALSDARAMVPGLVAEKAEPEADRKAFLKLCAWHMRYSPLVTPYGANDIFIDITGASHLFGGEDDMLDEARARLRGLGVEACGAIAGSAGAAFALAHTHRRFIVPEGDERRALAGLPVSMLRLEAGATENLMRLGLKTIGQLYDMPRAPLTARFGARLNRRLDQALAIVSEPLTPLHPAPDYSAIRKLVEPIATQESILVCLDALANDIETVLSKGGKGGRRFDLALYRVDNEVTRISVGASAPARDASHIKRLFRDRLDDHRNDLDAGFGFELVRLSAHQCQPLAAMQVDALAANDTKDDAAALIDRLSNRLGPRNVVRMRVVDTHAPERAVSYAPALSRAKNPLPAPLAAARPLRLLKDPEAIDVMAEVPDGPPLGFKWRRASYRVVKASGPERIESEWWRGKAGPPRDYYRVETAQGWRFWIFRAGFYGDADAAPEWRLHGFFA
ncbi:MAG: DNA polymerase Y family protein [Parvularculaceae bacterium]|nr:DNA polymerase Y family protein [Parvularculaceae bacterium]